MENFAPPGFDPQTDQSIVNHYQLTELSQPTWVLKRSLIRFVVVEPDTNRVSCDWLFFLQSLTLEEGTMFL